MNQEQFLNTPLGNAAEQLNVLLGSKGLRLAEDATVRHAIHGLKRAGLDARETVQTLFMVGVFDPYIAWVDTVSVSLTDMDTMVTHIEPMIPDAVAVDRVQIICVDCDGAKGPAIYAFRTDAEESLGIEGEGICGEDYIAFMTDDSRSVAECEAFNASLVPL